MARKSNENLPAWRQGNKVGLVEVPTTSVHIKFDSGKYETDVQEVRFTDLAQVQAFFGDVPAMLGALQEYVNDILTNRAKAAVRETAPVSFEDLVEKMYQKTILPAWEAGKKAKGLSTVPTAEQIELLKAKAADRVRVNIAQKELAEI